jgi:AraC-like DNA-binding protein
MQFLPQSLVWTRGVTEARRLNSTEKHECLTLIYPDDWLQETLRHSTADLPIIFRSLLLDHSHSQALCTRLLTPDDITWARSKMAHHLCEGARKILEVSQLTTFLITETFPDTSLATETETVTRSERINQERIDRVKSYLIAHMEDSPSLEQLALVAGCSSFYLSRSFTQQEGMTLSQWLRRTRIQSAAQLLSSGDCNVSEASLRVGYKSFSHFSQAFSDQMGLPPSKWLQQLTTPQT